MATTETQKALEAAVTHAAKELSKCSDPQAAAAWQGIINQNMAALASLESS